jgi:hypothetical protein
MMNEGYYGRSAPPGDVQRDLVEVLDYHVVSVSREPLLVITSRIELK